MNRSQTVSLGGPPRVDLIPVELRLRRTARTTARMMAALTLVVVVAMVAGYAVVFARLLGVQAEVDAATARTAELAVERTEFAETEAALARVRLGEVARSVGGATDVEWPALIRSAGAELPSDARLTSVTVTAGSPLELFPQAIPPLQPARVASITFTVTAPRFTTMSGWLTSLRELPGFTDATVLEMLRRDGIYEGTVIVHVDSGAFSNRFAVSEETEQ